MTDARLRDALDRIDAANSADPNAVTVRGATGPLAQVHGWLACEWVERHGARPREARVVSARGPHMRRGGGPRSTYPEGRAGYLRWRSDQKSRHCEEVAEILTGAGYRLEIVQSVQELIRLKGRSKDTEPQALEDASCLAFIETQLVELSESLDRPHMVEVIRKTARKMSPAAIELVAEIELSAQAQALLTEALT